ncbi:thymidylate kinase-like [Oscarella lobularis]|uniref:thymidylate kinase-like n=1 Tax=Oscarella lobularis TaxID=121494 RepID=UPI0033140B85
MRRGALIVLEGCDRSGKSTQCRKLAEGLKNAGKSVELMQFPNRTTEIGSVISRYLEKKIELHDAAIHLLFSANRWEMANRMKSMLESGTTLVVDRYAYSGIAFTGAKQKFSLDWCRQSDRGLPKPDLVIYLDLPPHVAKTRADYGDERYEKEEFQRKVAECYEKLREDDWKIINADQSVDSLHESIKALSLETIKSCGCEPIHKLWVNE